MDNPFDDPTFREQMKRLGVVHAPGMAAAHLAEIAPLLAAEGIDLDNLGADVSLDEVNAALARANEQHNIVLMTPVGAHREGALGTLRGVAEALAEGDDAAAERILARIQPDPQGDVPAASHVIGVALGLLDTWHTDPALGPALAGIRFAKWDKNARAAATDVVALATRGRAFDAAGPLTVNHGGLNLYRGAALAVAGVVAAVARRSGRSVAQIAAERIGGTLPAAPAGSAFRPGHTARPVVLREFARWVGANEHDIAAPTVDEELQMMDALLDLAARCQLDPGEPDDVIELADVVYEFEDDTDLGADFARNALATLRDFAMFRADTEPSSDWEEAIDEIDAMLDDDDDALAVLLDEARDAASTVSRAERAAAVARARIVTAVPEVLGWVGDGRTVTATGSVRRSDIAEVARMIGIEAVGVAKREAEPGQPLQVRAASELPMLAAWWDALMIAQVLEATSTKVRRGPAADGWLSDDGTTTDAQEMLIALFIAEIVLKATDDGTGYGQMLAAVMITDLARIAAGRPVPVVGDDAGEVPRMVGHLRAMTRVALDPLADAGLLQRTREGDLVAEPALRGVIVPAVALTRSLVEMRMDAYGQVDSPEG